jgi:hypothetical protein
MSEQRESSDELQEHWQHQNVPEENVETTVEQVLEQDRKYRDSARRGDVIAAVGALVFLPLLLLASATGKWPEVRAGYGLMAVGCGISAVALWLYHRLNRQTPRRDLTVRDHLEQSVAFLERQATLLRTSTLWCGLPLFLGAILVGAGIWMHMSKLAGALIAGGGLLAWIGSWHMNNVRKVREIAQRKTRAEDLLRRLA